jgi:hypothetical protein
MRKVLHLGVTEVPYTYGSRHRTTGDVAKILESKYGVVRRFVDDNRDQLIELFGKEAGKAVSAAITGKPEVSEPLQGALDRLQRSFRKYILARSLDGRVAGVPTAAAVRGINHRLKHPYAKRNHPRQSFFDTGLYIGAFKAWFDAKG